MVLFLQLAFRSRQTLLINSPVNGNLHPTTEKNIYLFPQTRNSVVYPYSGLKLENGVNLNKPASCNPFSIKCGLYYLLYKSDKVVQDQRQNPIETFLINFSKSILLFSVFWNCPSLLWVFFCYINYLLFFYTRQIHLWFVIKGFASFLLFLIQCTQI